jgi:hypothetical protein
VEISQGWLGQGLGSLSQVNTEHGALETLASSPAAGSGLLPSREYLSRKFKDSNLRTFEFLG